jgi:GNAT superfamily N-acetyltransferase
MLNRVTGLGLGEPATDEHLGAIEAFYEQSRAQYAVAVAPHALPAELTGMLAERGFVSGYAWTKFTREVGAPQPGMTDLRVERVGTERGADFALVVREGYELPAETESQLGRMPAVDGFDCYVAYADDEPAAAGVLFTDGAAGWFGFAATRAAFRRRGGQSALIAARIRRAEELGVQTLVTETGERQPDRPSNSYRNIVRAGFRPAYVRPNFVLPPR